MAKKLISFVLVITMMLTVCLPVHAKTVKKKPKDGRYYRIRYAANDRYLDIPSDSYNDNGTQLQVWDYAYGHQNQVFYFKDTGNGWHITAMNGKIVEVRDSSHDDFASVAQWDYHELKCGLWKIVKNSDGTVSFKNKESGKYLNVEGGGDATNGTRIIQYRNDKTIAMKFYLERLDNEDVLSAFYERKMDKSEIQWTEYNPIVENIRNESPWTYQKDGVNYYPSVGQKIFVSMEFLSPNTAGNMVRERSYDKSLWSQITEAVNGEVSTEVVSQIANNLAKEFGIERDIPFIGCALSLLKIVSESEDQNRWNRFVNAASLDERGRSAGVIVYTYYEVVDQRRPGPVYNALENDGSDWWHYIRVIPHVEYKSWSGDNFGDVSGTPVNVVGGKWAYAFK